MNFIKQVRSWNTKRQTREMLKGLSDHQLQDIGVFRDGTLRNNAHYVRSIQL